MIAFKNLLIFLCDFFIYPFEKIKTHNRFHWLLDFLFKDYPAFFAQKPSIWRILMLPWLVRDTVTKQEHSEVSETPEKSSAL